MTSQENIDFSNIALECGRAQQVATRASTDNDIDLMAYGIEILYVLIQGCTRAVILLRHNNAYGTDQCLMNELYFSITENAVHFHVSCHCALRGVWIHVRRC